MLLARQKGTIAEWRFEGALVSQLNWGHFEYTVHILATINSILSAEKLMFPHTICLSHWMRAGDTGVAQSERFTKEPLELRLDSSNAFEELLRLCRSIFVTESAYPVVIETSGSGQILTQAGPSIVEDLVWTRASTLDALMVTLGTQSDAWLPFSLSGVAQQEVYELNFERLARTLREIQRQTGFSLEEGVESPYSVIRGFYLENVKYEDGSVADVS